MPPNFPLNSVDRFGDSNSKGTLMETNNMRLDDCLRYCIVAGKKALEGADPGGDRLKKDKSVATLKDEEDDDEIIALNERTATYNLDSPPNYVEEVEVSEIQIKNKGPTKRATDTKKKPLSTVTEISCDEDDENYELEEPA